jgi:hypothetical protein
MTLFLIARSNSGPSFALNSASESYGGSSVCDLGVSLKGNRLPVAYLDHVGEGRLHNDVALAPASAGMTDRQDAPIGRFNDLLRPKLQPGENFIREALPLAHPIVTVEDARYGGVGRVTPFDGRIEERQDPLDALGLVCRVGPSC